MGKMRIKMIGQQVKTLDARTVKPLAAERLRGSGWMAIRRRIMRRDNGLCQCDDCKASDRPLIAHQVDHIVELADGGTDADGNLRAINVHCHDRKTRAAAAARAGRST